MRVRYVSRDHGGFMARVDTPQGTFLVRKTRGRYRGVYFGKRSYTWRAEVYPIGQDEKIKSRVWNEMVARDATPTRIIRRALREGATHVEG